MKKGMNS